VHPTDAVEFCDDTHVRRQLVFGWEFEGFIEYRYDVLLVFEGAANLQNSNCFKKIKTIQHSVVPPCAPSPRTLRRRPIDRVILR
jgi:hypothetical protein